jgi:hypothetical protein
MFAGLVFTDYAFVAVTVLLLCEAERARVAEEAADV